MTRTGVTNIAAGAGAAASPATEQMHLLVTGGTGVLGRVFLPLAEAAGHDLRAPARAELDLFDPAAVGAAEREHGPDQ